MICMNAVAVRSFTPGCETYWLTTNTQIQAFLQERRCSVVFLPKIRCYSTCARGHCFDALASRPGGWARQGCGACPIIFCTAPHGEVLVAAPVLALTVSDPRAAGFLCGRPCGVLRCGLV